MTLLNLLLETILVHKLGSRLLPAQDCARSVADVLDRVEHPSWADRVDLERLPPVPLLDWQQLGAPYRRADRPVTAAWAKRAHV